MVFSWEIVSRALDVVQFLGILGGIGGGLYYMGRREQGFHDSLEAAKEVGENLAKEIKETGEHLGQEIKDMSEKVEKILTVQAAHAAHIDHLRSRAMTEIRP